MLPTNAMIIPHILPLGILVAKSNAPVIIAKMGVKEFNAPASELSMRLSATQKRYAGIRLPNVPEKNMSASLLKGMLLICLNVTGSKIMPADNILIEAT